MALTCTGIYKNHRIHASRLFSGVWVASIVTRTTANRMAGTQVIHIPGEFASMEAAEAAAKLEIDTNLQPGGSEAGRSPMITSSRS